MNRLDFYSWDVWLTEDGVASVCEADPDTAIPDIGDLSNGGNALLVQNCGKTIGARCWEWNICPTSDTTFDLVDYDDGLTTEEQAEEDSWLQWYGGWGSFGMGIDPLEDKNMVPGYVPVTKGGTGFECEECDPTIADLF